MDHVILVWLIFINISSPNVDGCFHTSAPTFWNRFMTFLYILGSEATSTKYLTQTFKKKTTHDTKQPTPKTDNQERLKIPPQKNDAETTPKPNFLKHFPGFFLVCVQPRFKLVWYVFVSWFTCHTMGYDRRIVRPSSFHFKINGLSWRHGVTKSNVGAMLPWSSWRAIWPGPPKA